jgi:hypothetical protein
MRDVGVCGKGSDTSGLEGVGVTDPTGERCVNTDRLIDLLSANLEPVGRVQFGRMLLAAMLAGSAAALILMLMTVGPRADFASPIHLSWTALKLLFAVSVIGTATPLLLRSMRPGLEKETYPGLIFLPFLAAIAVALAMLLFVTPQNWSEMLRGATSASPPRCLSCIIFFAVVPFAALIWVLRQAAPTRLSLSGAIAGVVAGGLGAAAYAFACTSDTIPFIAVCYGVAIALCAFIGSQLGPRLLRW